MRGVEEVVGGVAVGGAGAEVRDEVAGEGGGGEAGGEASFGGKELFGDAVLHELEADEEAEAADVADGGLALLETVQGGEEVGAGRAGVGDQVVVEDVSEDGGAGGAGAGIAGGGVADDEGGAAASELADELGSGEDGAEGA